MFAYCNNNPISSADTSGKLAWEVIGGVIGGVFAGIAAIAIILADNYLAKNYPATEDSQGGIAYKKVRKPYVTGRLFYAEGGGFKFDKLNGMSLIDFQAGLVETNVGNEYLNGSITNLATIKATAVADWSGNPSFELSGLISLYTANVECMLPLFIGDLTMSGAFHVGAIGFGGEYNPDDMSIGAETPLIPGIVIEWDIDFDLYSGT